MKRGQYVAVCYDGKWSRRVQGVVIATKQTKILVRFTRWADENEEVIETWFPRRNRRRRWGGIPHYHAKFVSVDGPSVMSDLLGMPGEWYGVYKWPKGEVPETHAPNAMGLVKEIKRILL